MAIVMMIQILLSVALMVETAVWLMLLQIIAQNALVIIIKRLVLLDFFLHQLEMAIVMMKPTMVPVIMMLETAV